MLRMLQKQKLNIKENCWVLTVTDGIEELVLQTVGLLFQDLTELAGELQAYADSIEEVKLWDEG